MSNKRFFSEEHVQAFLNFGILPAIHNDMGVLLDNFLRDGEVCMDLGSCTGLLGVRAIRAGAKKVIGIEASKRYIEKAINHPNIEYHNMHVAKETLDDISDLIVRNKVTSILARRVIPEIAAHCSVGTIYDLSRMFNNLGIQKIFIEGRVLVENAKSHFSSIEKEIEAFSTYYKVTSHSKNAYLLTKI
ncbi:MAG: 50S ribosomal protein L11 methyltransferase [Raineya sp.]|jgi:predicted rRNA methylase YqxC with S4 and FtsJ domains|nr:50S ribosomal protein L11 methyltransferase [Raineya sp.]